MVFKPFGVPETISRSLRVQNYVPNNTEMLIAFSRIDICTVGTEVMMGKIAGTLS